MIKLRFQIFEDCSIALYFMQALKPLRGGALSNFVNEVFEGDGFK